RLAARERVPLEGDVSGVLLHPAEEPGLAEDRRRALPAEGVFGCRERDRRDLVRVDEIGIELERRHHLRAVREARGFLEVRRQHPRAERVREWQKLVGDAHGMALVAERETDLGWLAPGVEHGQLLHRHQPVVERLRWLVGIEASLLEELRVNVHLLEVLVLYRDDLAHALPQSDVDDVI